MTFFRVCWLWVVITRRVSPGRWFTSSAVRLLLGASHKCSVDAYTGTSEELKLRLMFFFFKEGRKARVSAAAWGMLY